MKYLPTYKRFVRENKEPKFKPPKYVIEPSEDDRLYFFIEKYYNDNVKSKNK